MTKKATVRRLALPPGRRVLAVSDLHGNLPFLLGLMKTVAFTPDDILILVGDLVEKGPDSLTTLRYLMALSKTHTVYSLRGNCDDLVLEFTDETSQVPPGVFDHYLGVWGGRSLLLQMGRSAGFMPKGIHDLPALRETLRSRFRPELDFLRSLPTILETPDYLFVHGGVPREDRLEELESRRCMKNDDFLGQGHAFDRWCVVGHWPVTLYSAQVQDASPLLLYDRHIASIDGGCSLKLDGQLNALILPDAPGGAFSWASYDGLPKVIALEAQTASSNSINIRWGRSWVEVLEHGAEFSLCRHRETGRTLFILTDFLRHGKDGTHCEDATDYHLPVTPGDTLSLVRTVTGGCLAKKNGVTGWYFGRFQAERSE